MQLDMIWTRPVINKIDIFMLGYVKNRKYQIPPTIQNDMRKRIRATFLSIDVERFGNVNRSLGDRCNAVLMLRQTFRTFSTLIY